MKKHISLLLALCMLFTMLPMGMTVVSATTTTVTQSVDDPSTETDVIEISTLQSEITLTFTPAVADASAVTFTKADGSAVKGAVVGTAGVVDGGSTYTLKFGRLEDKTEYTLTVPASVTSNSSDTVFTYKASEPDYEVYDDFNGADYVEGEPAPATGYSADNKKGLRYFNGTSSSKDFAETGANVDIREEQTKVVADGTDDKAIEMWIKDLDSTGATADAARFRQATMTVATSQFSTQLTGERDVYVIESAVKNYLAEGTTTRGASIEQYHFYPNSGGSLLQANKNAKFSAVNIKGKTNAQISYGTDGWLKSRVVLRMGGLYSSSTNAVTTPVKPAANEGTGNLPLQVTDLYDLTGDTPVYYGESSKYSVNSNLGVVAIIDGRYSGGGANCLNDRVAVDYVKAKKDKAMTVLKQETSYVKEGSLVFYMSDDIDASTLSAITVTDTEGVAVEGFTTAADNTNRTITVSFPNGIETEGTYTVDLSKVIGTNGVAVYNGKYYWNTEYEGTDVAGYLSENLASIDFEVTKEQSGSYDAIASSTPAADATDVSVHVGTASVTYDVELDAETLDGITLVSVVDGTETALKGKVTKTLSDDGKTVTFKFGRLAAGLHRIKVDGTVLKNADGEIVSTENIEFTTVDTEQTKLDFTETEGFVARDDEVEGDKGTIPEGKRIIDLNNALSVVADGDNQYVRVQPPTEADSLSSGKHYGLIYDLTKSGTWTGSGNGAATGGIDDHALTDVRDVFVIDTAIKPSITGNSGGGAQTALALTPCVASSESLTLPKDTASVTGAVKANTTNMINGSTDALTLTNGWAKARAVLRKDGKISTWTDKWAEANMTPSGNSASVTIDLYDATSGSVKYIDTVKGGSISSYGFKIVNFLVGASAGTASQNYADVDYIYTKKEKAMTVMESDLGYTKDNKQVVFYMTDDIDASSLNTITVTDANGTALAAEDVSATADAAMRAITVSFPNGLSTAGTYTVDLSKVLGTNGVAVYNGVYVWDETTSKYASHENLASIDFEVAGDAAGAAFKLIGVTSGDVEFGETLDADAGEITVEFTAALKDGAAELITLAKADGSRVAGKVVKTVDGTNVTLKFGRLEEGVEYTLNIPATVTGADGAAITAKSYTFTATREYEIKNDFSEIAENTVIRDSHWNTAADPSGTIIGLTEANGFSSDLSTADFGVVLDGVVTAKKNGDDTYLEMAPAAGATTYNRIAMYLVPRKAAGTYTTVAGKYFKTGGEAVKDGYVLAMDASLNAQAVDANATVSYNAKVFGSYNSTALARYAGSAAVGTLTNYWNASYKGIEGSYSFNTVTEKQYNTARQVISANADPAEITYAGLNYKLYDLDNGKYVGKQADPSKVQWDCYTQLAIQTVSSTEGTDNVKFNLTDFAVFYAKAMEVLDTQFDEDAGKLTIAMTDAIDADTAANMVITTGGVALAAGAFVTACNEEERTIEVTFPLGLKAGEYSVSLANVEPKNGLYDGKAATSFTVAKDSLKLGITGVTSNEVALGNTIDADAGEITIEFSDTLTDGAKDQIALTKANGNSIGGKVIKTQDGAKVTLNFGRLEEGEKYVLTIPDTVKSLDGAAIDAKTYTFTATREYLINAQDQFSKIDAGTKLHEGAVAWTAATGDKKDNDIRTGGADKGYSEALSNDNFRISLDGDVTMKTTESGEKYLEMAPAENHTSNSVGAYIVPKTVNSSYTFTGRFLKNNPGYVLAMDATLNTQAVDPDAKAAHNTSVFAIYHRDMAKFAGSEEMGRFTTYYGEKVGGINISPAYQFNAVAANEYNTARTVMSSTEATPADGTNSYKLYDLDNGAYVGENARPDLVTWTALARLAIQSVDTTGNVGSDNVMINLKDYKAFLAKSMSVLDTQLNSEDYVVTIALSDAIDPKTADNLVITLDGEVVNSATYDVECDEEERTIEISFPYGLKVGVYNVSLAGVEPKNGLFDGSATTSFEVEEGSAVYIANFTFEGSADGGDFKELVSGTAEEGQISIGDADTIQVSAEIGGVDAPAVFLAVYDEDYNLVDVVKVNNDGTGVYTATLDELPTDTVKHASMYIWESLDTLKPLFKPLQCL